MEKISRRVFIKNTVYLSISAAISLAGCEGKSKNSSSKPKPNPIDTTNPTVIQSGKKALVYLILNGGNDSFNMLVPRGAKEYAEYATSRSNLSLNKEDLKSLDFIDKNGKTFGLHPAMSKTKDLFNSKKMCFVANVGPLVEKTTKTQFQTNSVSLPLGLMSHSDQRRHWQTIQADKRTNIGLFGKFADEFQQNKRERQISMNISLGGTNILQNGINSTEYSITENGSIGLRVKETTANPAMNKLNDALLGSFNTILNKSYTDSFEKTYIETTKNAQAHHEEFTSQTKDISISHKFINYDSRTDIKFTSLDKSIPKQFQMIAKSIKASAGLGMEKQTFHIDYYGWDHHDELTNNHNRMLEVVDNALWDFQQALEELGVANNVITVVGSDFGRTLSSNGNGTDHGWGGNAMIMGNSINGGKIYGEYPTLALNSNLDIGGGVLIPTTSIDEVFAELAYWFGVKKQDLKSYIPNIEKFYSLSSKNLPLGFIKV